MQAVHAWAELNDPDDAEAPPVVKEQQVTKCSNFWLLEIAMDKYCYCKLDLKEGRKKALA